MGRSSNHSPKTSTASMTSATYEIRKWVEQQRKGRDLWRVKLLDIKGLAVPFRILYARSTARNCYFVLAIMARSIDYDESHERIRRALAVYDGLGL
jgi:hypothetical protein